ncbi:MAG: ABC transporter substrate-binding protein [Actinomycetota bacterium]
MTGRPLRLGGVPEHFNLPWHLAMEGGDLDGIDVEWADQPGGTGDMLTGLADGTLDLVSILTEGTVAAVGAGLDATVLQVYVSTPLRWGVFVPGASDHTDESSLAGRPIAVSRLRSGSHLMAFVQAERNGWALSADQFVITGGLDGARNAFAAGEAEMFLWDQYMTRSLVDAGEFRQVGVHETPWPSFVVAVRNEVLSGRTTEVGRVVDAVVARAVALHDRPGIVDELTARYGLDTDTAEAWLATTAFGPRGPWDPAIGADVRRTLAAAGLS